MNTIVISIIYFDMQKRKAQVKLYYKYIYTTSKENVIKYKAMINQAYFKHENLF